MSFLELQNINKHFSDYHAIKNVNLKIEKKSFVVFVGPSGCGKSTLLRMIAGLESVDSGHLILEGKDITEVKPSKRNVAMVFQSYALYPHMKVEDNMSFALRLAGEPKDKIRDKVKSVAETLNLTPYLKRLPKELSGGQRQRVAIGRAIVRQPKLFLFDEPLSNLDAALRTQTRVEIANLHKNLHATSIYVTHDQVEAMTLADQVVVLNMGEIEQVGAPLDLYDHPANLFVAQFLGTPKMNTLQLSKLSPVIKKEMELTAKKKKIDFGKVHTVGLRPEHVIPSSKKDKNFFQAKVVLMENLGLETILYTDTSSGPITSLQQRRSALHRQENVNLEIDMDKIIFFDDRGINLSELSAKTKLSKS